jgi:hypothetical protein
MSLDALDKRVAFGVGQAARHELHYPGIGIHERKRGSIGFLPQP